MGNTLIPHNTVLFKKVRRFERPDNLSQKKKKTNWSHLTLRLAEDIEFKCAPRERLKSTSNKFPARIVIQQHLEGVSESKKRFSPRRKAPCNLQILPSRTKIENLNFCNSNRKDSGDFLNEAPSRTVIVPRWGFAEGNKDLDYSWLHWRTMQTHKHMGDWKSVVSWRELNKRPRRLANLSV